MIAPEEFEPYTDVPVFSFDSRMDSPEKLRTHIGRLMATIKQLVGVVQRMEEGDSAELATMRRLYMSQSLDMSTLRTELHQLRAQLREKD